MVQVKITIHAVIDIDIEDLRYDSLEDYLDNLTVSDLASNGEIEISEE